MLLIILLSINKKYSDANAVLVFQFKTSGYFFFDVLDEWRFFSFFFLCNLSKIKHFMNIHCIPPNKPKNTNH